MNRFAYTPEVYRVVNDGDTIMRTTSLLQARIVQGNNPGSIVVTRIDEKIVEVPGCQLFNGASADMLNYVIRCNVYFEQFNRKG